MKRTKVYHRDIPRVENGPLRRRYSFDDDDWENVLTWLEKRRSKTATMPKSEYDTRNFYEYGLGALGEVGENTDDFTQNVDAWYSSTSKKQQSHDLQRIATRLAQTFNPEDKGENGGGGGNGNKNEESQGQGQSSQEESEDDDEEEEETPQVQVAYGGGGRQRYGESQDETLFLATRYLIRKLAEHDDYSERVVHGHTTWDAKRLLSGHWNPTVYDEAKQDYGRQVEDIYLILDTSGSVSRLANNIAAIAAGAAGIVHLYSGSEASPVLKVNRTTPLRSPRDPFPEWGHQQRIHANAMGGQAWVEDFIDTHSPLYPEWVGQRGSIEAEIAWFLHLEKPPKNSRILFWGDTQGADIYCPRLFAALLRPYRAAWLLSERYEENWPESMRRNTSKNDLIYNPTDYDSPGWPKLEAVGIPVIENIQTAEHVRGMLQQLQMLR